MPAPVRRLEKNQPLTHAEGDAHLDAIDMPTKRTVTMNSAGVINIDGPGPWWVETFGGAMTQNLTGITGGSGRMWPIILLLNTAGRTITIVHTPPNLLLDGQHDALLNSTKDSVPFRDIAAGVWVEMGGRVSIPE
jgi:hypothetical protein